MLYQVWIYLFLQWLNRTDSDFEVFTTSKAWSILLRADPFSTSRFFCSILYTFPTLVILKLPVASRTMGELFQEVNSVCYR